MAAADRYGVEERLMRSAFRQARWLERLGGMPQGSTLARMRGYVTTGEVERAMAVRDEIQRQFSRAAFFWLSLVAAGASFIAFALVSGWFLLSTIFFAATASGIANNGMR